MDALEMGVMLECCMPKSIMVSIVNPGTSIKMLKNVPKRVHSNFKHSNFKGTVVQM